MPTDYERAVYESDRMQREAIREADADGTLDQERLDQISEEAKHRLRFLFWLFNPYHTFPNNHEGTPPKNS